MVVADDEAFETPLVRAAMALAVPSSVEVRIQPLSAVEYASLLEKVGFDLRVAEEFDRPTPLESPGGLRDWLRMFRPDALDQIPETLREAFFRDLEERSSSDLFRDGVWHADYRRLRFLAVRR